MFRIRIRNEKLWRNARKIPVLNKLVRADLQSISAMKNPETIDLAFSKIDLLSGVSKQTNKDRFAAVDKHSVEIILNRSMTRVLDVGVSSGITSLELLRRLQSSSFKGQLLISDKFARFWVNRFGRSTAIYDADFKLVCAYLGPIAGDSEDTWKLPLSKYVFDRALKRGFDDRNKENFLLLHPDVLDAIQRGEIEFVDFDVFKAEQGDPFDFVRCMNLLNTGYFTRGQIEVGLKTLHTSLVKGGVLQIGRTHLDGSNHVSFYEKVADGFQHIESTGNGSEVDAWIAAIRIRPQQADV